MATLEDVEAARLAHQDRFGAMGAHAIEIQPVREHAGYELIVHVAKTPPDGFPRSVRAGKAATVPVQTKTTRGQ
jgi:hypothetical protein